MSKYLFILLLLLGITAKANAQEMMLNGSFEDCDGVAPPGTPYLYSIEYGSYWHNLIGTADLVNPCVPESSGSPCFGVGAGRFGVSSGGYIEYLYGQTLPLTAGQLYEVSFWIRKDYQTETLRKVGLAITDQVPTPAIHTTTPLISALVTSTQCVQLKQCFTAQTSGTHYITLGPFGGEGTTESLLYLVDSVSVKTIPPGTPLAQASLSASEPVLCYGEQVTLDGTASVNETSYEWNIYNTSTGNNLFYSSGIIQGTAGTLTPTLQFPIPGSCYRAELTVYGVCKEVATVEFCIADPDIDFIFDGNPVCENFPVDLQVTGDNGWTYTWSDATDTLSSGTGLKTLTVTPTIGNSAYTVTVTTLEGCSYSETLNLNVSSPTNIAPWMDGINGTGEYTYYVRQGDAVFFNSVLSNDHPNEEIDLIPDTDIPPGYATIPPGSSGGIFSFSWVTSLSTNVGEYYYEVTAFDNNACNADTNTFKFRIIVVCDQCPVCVDYENRTPSGTPLPPETKAGKCIQAGLSQAVSTGTANVLFQAGVSIETGAFFDAGPGYQAIIEPTTCITDCEDCCTDWAGFTYDEFPTPILMNFDDNDPTNDIFQLTDINHPFCAYGAKGYHLEIVRTNGSDNPMNSNTGYQTTECCAFRSPAPENPIPHASIWWDGYYTNIWGNQTRAEPQAYVYMIELYGCNGEYLVMHGNIYIQTVSNLTQNPNPQNADALQELNSSFTPEQQEQLNAMEAEREQLDKTVSLFPNPTTDLVQVTGTGSEDVYYQVFDDKGIMISRKEKVINQSFSLADYSKGTYYIRIYSGTTYVVRKVVKM